MGDFMEPLDENQDIWELLTCAKQLKAQLDDMEKRLSLSFSASIAELEGLQDGFDDLLYQTARLYSLRSGNSGQKKT